MTTTSSSRRMRSPMLEHLRRERDDLHEVALAQLARDRPEDAGAARLVLRVQEHRGVVVEADLRSVGAPVLLRLAHDDGADDLALLHARVRDRILHRGNEHVTDFGRRAGRGPEHPDHRELACTAVVRTADARVWADQAFVSADADFSLVPSPAPSPSDSVSTASALTGARISSTPSCVSSCFSMSATSGAAAPASPAREMTSMTRQRFVALNGRLSWMRTRSPARTSPFSLCAAKRFPTRSALRYSGCWRMRSTSTMTVFAIFAETTMPTFVRRCVFGAVPRADSPAAGAALRRTVVRFETVFSGAAVFFSAAGAALRVAAARVTVLRVPLAAVVFFVTVPFGSTVSLFLAVVFRVVVVFFSAIRGPFGRCALLHDGQHPGDAAAGRRHLPVVLQLARGELEAHVEQLFLRRLELVLELGIRQPPHVLQLHLHHLPVRGTSP